MKSAESQITVPFREGIMGSATMGKVFVRATIENLGDVEMRERGLLRPEQVRRLDVPDALVDTGASTLLLPKRLIQQLGLRHYRTRQAKGVGGSMPMPMYSAVWLTIEGRECAVDVGEVSDDLPVLIGQIPLEALDLVVDCKGQRLIGNPAHGGEHIMEAY
jgi:predicted aspartyl protease